MVELMKSISGISCSRLVSRTPSTKSQEAARMRERVLLWRLLLIICAAAAAVAAAVVVVFAVA